ncbi:MAG: hypothetical protein MUF49_28220 [Oculatellaceae cyanobacterium Prado106]|nr:hypothetical protein [Oculatellaceae cyanobacterium Prado106]
MTTRQPLSELYANFTFEAGSYGLLQPSIDLSEPLTEDDTALFRFIASYQNADGVQDFVNKGLTVTQIRELRSEGVGSEE